MIAVHDDGGHRVRALGRLSDIEAQHLAFGPDSDRAAYCFGQQPMTQKRVFELLVEQHVDGLAQREQQMHRRGAGIFAVMLDALALGPVPIGRAQIGLPVHLAGAVVGGDKAQARRRHQALLRSGHRNVDAPGIHLERHATKRGHGIDHEQGRVAGRLDDLADRLDVVIGARRRIDLHREDRLDLVILVLAQPRLDLGGPDGAAPVALEHFHLRAHCRGGVAPADREAAAFQHQHLVAARQHVAERGLPGAMAVGDMDVGAALGREQFAEIAQQTVGQFHHLVGIDIERGAVHRPQHFVGHVGGPGDRQKFPACTNCHC